MPKTAIEGDRQEERPLKIGEVAKRSGIAVDTLRFYERQGLLGRPARTESGYRLYPAAVFEQLEFIKRAQALGFSLDEIGGILAERRAGQIPCRHVREVVRRRLVKLDEELETLRRYRRELAKALGEWEESGDRPGRVCGHIEATELHAALPAGRSAPRRKG